MTDCDSLLNYLRLSAADATVLVVAMRKRFAAEFKIPFQKVYEKNQDPAVAARYEFIVDGDALSGQRIPCLRRGDPPTRAHSTSDIVGFARGAKSKRVAKSGLGFDQTSALASRQS